MKIIERLNEYQGLFGALFFVLLFWIIGHFIWHACQPPMIPVPPLWYKDGVWHADGSSDIADRACNGAQAGETITFDGMSVVWSSELKSQGGYINFRRAKPPAPEEQDHEDIYAEVENGKTAEASEAMMWAIRSDPKYKWAELRWKDPEGKILLVVRHTKPKEEAPISETNPAKGTLYEAAKDENGKDVWKKVTP